MQQLVSRLLLVSLFSLISCAYGMDVALSPTPSETSDGVSADPACGAGTRSRTPTGDSVDSVAIESMGGAEDLIRHCSRLDREGDSFFINKKGEVSLVDVTSTRTVYIITDRGLCDILFGELFSYYRGKKAEARRCVMWVGGVTVSMLLAKKLSLVFVGTQRSLCANLAIETRASCLLEGLSKDELNPPAWSCDKACKWLRENPGALNKHG